MLMYVKMNYKLNLRGFMKMNTVLQVGQKVHCILYGGNDGIIYKIVGEQKPETIKCLGGGFGVMGGNAEIYIVFNNGSRSVVPESIVHGVQWRIYDQYFTETEIEKALHFAEETEEKNRQKAEAEKQRKIQEKERILKEFSYLVNVQDSKRGPWAVGSQNIKKELKLKFPGAEFKVSSDSYSGGCSIDVNWTDGPSFEDVEKIINKYQKGHFNGMEDIYEYDSANIWPDIYGGANYVSANRNYSKEAQIMIANQENIKINFNSYNGIEFEDNSDRYRFYDAIKKHSFYKPQADAIKTTEASRTTQTALKVSKGINSTITNNATNRQLWILHCITKLDTRGWKLTYQQAYDLINQANKGVNIKDMVKEFIAC